MRLHSVFIYGSLLPGLSNHGVIKDEIRKCESGVIAGRLVDAGAYPAAVRDGEAAAAGSRIRGLWIAVGREGLAALDELEEFRGAEEMNDYERVWTRDAFDAGKAGWVYVWPNDRGCPEVGSDSWAEYWKVKQAGERQR